MSSLNISSLDKIIFMDSLKNHTDIHSIISLLVEKIKTIPAVENLHMNIDLIVWLCQVIDQILVDSKLKNIDKLALFKSIYTQIYPDTAEKELNTIKNVIEYLHNIKKIASVRTNFQKIGRNLKSFAKFTLSILSLS